jgi:crotonobetainyl-CoA:carnitine CoA-transferase CaiB-like acyl-CoA transferase
LAAGKKAAAQPRPLSGIRVLELGQIAAGPFAGSLLADLGADVVKVERPGEGDGLRQWPPLSGPEGGPTFSENFASINRNKRSLAADLKDPADVARVRALAARADVLIENFRPGVLSRLGLDYASLREDCPRLVYCSVSGYGHAGPYSDKGAFDLTVQAIAGLMSVTGEEGRAPVKCGVPVGDYCSGLYAALTILAAVIRRNQTGEGGHIDCSMLGSLIGVATLQTSEFFGTGRTPRRLGSAHPRAAPYRAFRAADEYFVVAAGNDKLWRSVCEVVGAPELTQDERFKTLALRAKNQDALFAILEPLFARRPAADWLRELDARGVPCAPINTYPQVLADPQVEAMGLVQPLELPNGVKTRTTAFPVKLTGYSFEVYLPPPELGAHTAEVMDDWLGLGAARGGDVRQAVEG